MCPRMVVFPEPDSPLEHVSGVREMQLGYSQEDNGLVLGAVSQARVGPVREVLGGLMGASLFTTIYTETRVCACVDGDNALGGEGRNGEVCVVPAGEGRSQARVVLLVLGQRGQRGVLQRVGSHGGQPRPRGSE